MLTLTCPSRDELLAYVAGRLADETSESIAAHLDACPDCQAGLLTLNDADDTFVAQLREPPVADPFLEESQCKVAIGRARIALKTTGETPALASGRSVRGTVLGEYELIEELGHGGMGTVYKALHTKLDRVVALKVLTTGRTQDSGAITRFGREMKAIGKLDHHHIVRAHDAREIDGTPVLVMEYIEGLDLTQIVRRLGAVPVCEACEMARQAALGLQYVHEHGLVHRDIKPSNLMLTDPLARSGRGAGGEGAYIKILDLGLARFHLDQTPAEETAGTGWIAGREMTGTDQAMGTADYMAPEQISNCRAADIRADIYSLGCTLYKLLTGRAPFDDAAHQGPAEKMAAHAGEMFPAICQVEPEVTASLAAVLDRMLAKSPAARFYSPAEVAEALAPYAKGADLAGVLKKAINRSATAPDFSSAGDARPLSSQSAASVLAVSGRRRRVICAAAVGLLLLGGLGWAFAVLLRIEKDGRTTEITIPGGSKVTIAENGNVDVKLPATAAVAASDIGPLTNGRAKDTRSEGLVPELPPTLAATLELRIAPLPASLDAAERKSCSDWLQAGRIGLWWKRGRISGRMPNYAWMPVAEATNTDRLITGMYQGEKYLLVSDKPGQIMTPGQGWDLESVSVDKDSGGSPEVSIRLDERGGQLLSGLSKANIGSQMAMIVDGRVVSAPTIRSSLFRDVRITGRFSLEEVEALVNKMLVLGSKARPDRILAEQPPVVVETSPISGARDVVPGEKEIRVRFSKEMTDGSWSWSTAWENSTPEFIRPPHYEADGRTCVGKVILEPGRTYGFWLNSENFGNFRDRAGRPAVPYLLIFQTKTKWREAR